MAPSASWTCSAAPSLRHAVSGQADGESASTRCSSASSPRNSSAAIDLPSTSLPLKPKYAAKAVLT